MTEVEKIIARDIPGAEYLVKNAPYTGEDGGEAHYLICRPDDKNGDGGGPAFNIHRVSHYGGEFGSADFITVPEECLRTLAEAIIAFCDRHSAEAPAEDWDADGDS